jgi:hypothetical protein
MHNRLSKIDKVEVTNVLVDYGVCTALGTEAPVPVAIMSTELMDSSLEAVIARGGISAQMFKNAAKVLIQASMALHAAKLCQTDFCAANTLEKNESIKVRRILNNTSLPISVPCRSVHIKPLT